MNPSSTESIHMKDATITNYPGFVFSGYHDTSTLFLRAIQQGKRHTFLCVETNPETLSITNWMPEIAEAVSEKFMTASATQSEHKKKSVYQKRLLDSGLSTYARPV